MRGLIPLLLVGLLSACAHSASVANLDRAAPPASDAQFYASDTAVSLAEAQRRLARQGEASVLQERVAGDPNFAGLYIQHQPDFRFVVRFIGDDPPAQLRRYTSDPIAIAMPAKYSWAELTTGQDKMIADLTRLHLYFLTAGTNVMTNSVELNVVDDADLMAAVRDGRFRLPPFVHIIEQGGVIADRPQRAGPVQFFPQARYPAGAYLMALSRGRLVLEGGCLRLAGGPGERGPLIVWPSMARLEVRRGIVHIIDSESGASIRIDRPVSLGGGHIDQLGDLPLVAPLPASCPGPYWSASPGWRNIELQ